MEVHSGNVFTANPGFHEIPPGYGLPWGTPAEEKLLFRAFLFNGERLRLLPIVFSKSQLKK